MSSLVRDTRSPLCDTVWEDEERLKAHLREKLERADEAQTIQRLVLESGAEVANQARRIAGLVDAAQPIVDHDDPEGFADALERWSEGLRKLASELSTVQTIAEQRQRFEDGWTRPPGSLKKNLEAVTVAIRAKPDQSSAVAARARARGYRSTRNMITMLYLITGKLKLQCQPM